MIRQGEATGARGANLSVKLVDSALASEQYPRPESSAVPTGYTSIHNGSIAAGHSKRGPALLPAPVSPDFGSWVPKDTWAWFRRHALLAPARACELRVGRRGRWVFTPEGASVSRPRRPAPLLPGAAPKPCWELYSEQSRNFEPLSPLSLSRLPVRLAPSLPPDVSVLLSQPFRIRPIGASPNWFPVVTRRFPPSSGPCKSLALLRFPSAPPPPYSYETVIESPRWEARNGPFALLITWIMGISGAISDPAASIRGEPARTRQSRTPEPPRN